MVSLVRARLSTVWWRTLPEIRPELPDRRWSSLPLATATDWAATRMVLNHLMAKDEVEVRLRVVADGEVPERGMAQQCVCRQEYKLKVHGGKRSRRRKCLFGRMLAPDGAR